jgi:uncharacterized membrane protein YqiK
MGSGALMPPVDFNALGSAIAALLIGAGIVITWWLNREAKNAKTTAEVAQSGAQRTVADAEHTLYKLLAERLATVEADLKAVRAEQAVERRHSRELEIHIHRLENLMRQAGLDPPERKFIVG